MDYFPNGDFTKSYPLPGIGYYMTSMPTSMTQHNQAPAGPGILSLASGGAPSMETGQHYMDNSEFAGYHQHQQHLYQQPPPPAVTRQYAGQKRRGGRGARGAARGQDPNGDETSSKEQRKDPFAPECSIPLPYQLGDEYSYYGPTAVWKRNERERHRVRCVNDGYERLRNHLPVPDKEKRLSKVETLRFAIRYIQHMEKMLADSHHDDYCDCDFTIRPSSVSDSCQSPAVSTTAEPKSTSTRGGKHRRNAKRVSSDDTSDDEVN